MFQRVNYKQSAKSRARYKLLGFLIMGTSAVITAALIYIIIYNVGLMVS